METERCPACAKATVVCGVLDATEIHPHPCFAPNHSRPFRRKPGVPIRPGGFRACASCGHAWATLDPSALRDFMREHGTELVRQQVDEFDEGPYRGLPATEAAREAADAVAEVDALARSGKVQGMAGRFRDLAGVTWDRALAVTRGWRDLPRDEKLALFGWAAKEKEKVAADEFF